MANGVAVVCPRERVEAGIRAEIVGTALDHGDRGDELILLVEVARVQRELARVGFVFECRGQLATIVGRELGISNTI
jgi:hypothetical protein